ncbi:MAG: hypothetical protein LBG62_03545 [Candidatus Methanoplasma sp.]|jgi:GTPase SAR1 family protein|nr:hypothetical protein [Candidatus Methanoplasma sp.]
MARRSEARAKREAGGGYTCPFCCKTVDLRNTHYQCTNPACAKMFLRGLRESGAKSVYMSRNLDEEVDVENTIFLGKDPEGPSPVTTRNHIMRDSSGICDMCKRPAYRRLCPGCHNPIPQGAEEEGSTVFVILGPKGVGKSHYIAVLINELTKSFSPEFGATMSPATDRTTLRYRESYYKRLYEEGRKLDPTASYEQSRDSREPMIYYLRFFGGDSPRVYTLAFFDTAGEDLDSAGRMMNLSLNSFTSMASGIVFLVDPLQIPYINSRIRMDNKPPQGKDVTDILSNISNAIRANRSMSPREPIDIPLAVVLTKSDVLMKAPENEEEANVLFGPGSSIHIDRERGRYDKTNFEQISVEIEEYMRRVASGAFVQMVKEFERHSYFAVSALGSNPTGPVLSRAISPMRVEDPFIWLLNCDAEGSGR